VTDADLAALRATGGLISDSDPRLRPTLAYVLQEYARYAGHLDVARELIDGTAGE
jgi:hypothetical protein